MAINTLNAAQKKEIKQQLIQQGHGAAAEKIFGKPKPKKTQKPKRARTQEESNFTAIFGGGLILTLVLFYLGIEHGFIHINF